MQYLFKWKYNYWIELKMSLQKVKSLIMSNFSLCHNSVLLQMRLYVGKGPLNRSLILFMDGHKQVISWHYTLMALFTWYASKGMLYCTVPSLMDRFVYFSMSFSFPFPHATYLQQMTFKTSKQKHRKCL